MKITLNTNHVGHIGKKFRKKNKEIFFNECWCQIKRFYLNINHSPTNCHAVANPIPCFQGCSNQIQVVWEFSGFHSFVISTLCSWELRNITPRRTVLSLAGENALISSITVMSSPSKATTRCQPVLLLPLFNIHRLGWNQRRSDFDNHRLWLLQPKALAFKSRQWLTQAICPSLEKINWKSSREIEGAKVSLKSSGMLNGGTTVQRTSGPLIPPALPQDITVLQKVPAGCLREILMEVCCLLTYPTSYNIVFSEFAVGTSCSSCPW